jgi:hypothetical protein
MAPRSDSPGCLSEMPITATLWTLWVAIMRAISLSVASAWFEGLG